MKRIIIIFTIILNQQLSYSQSKIEEAELARDICFDLYASRIQENSALSFENAILKRLKVKPTSDNERKQIISDFFNKNADILICGEDDNQSNTRKSQHLFKRSIAIKAYHFLYYLTETDGYTIDFNFFEIVDGEKETLLDYIDKIIANESRVKTYNLEHLEDIIDYVEEVGGKRGKELK